MRRHGYTDRTARPDAAARCRRGARSARGTGRAASAAFPASGGGRLRQRRLAARQRLGRAAAAPRGCGRPAPRRTTPATAPRPDSPLAHPHTGGAGTPRAGPLRRPFSVVSWFDGHPSGDRLAASEAWALGGFLRRLHAAPLPVAEAPRNPVRGVPLRLRAEAFEERLRAVESSLEPVLRRAARASFDAGVKASPAARRVWLHGDLHPRNLVQTHSRLTAVLDWGDLTAGDPATDPRSPGGSSTPPGASVCGRLTARSTPVPWPGACLGGTDRCHLRRVGSGRRRGRRELGRSALTRLIVSS